MGFPSAGIRAPNVFVTLTNHILHIRLLFMMTLTYFGLIKPVHNQDQNQHPILNLIVDQPLRGSVKRERGESIKERLPVLSYRAFLERNNSGRQNGGATCVVCLNGVGKRHEVRELANCCHVFHKECLDSWVDEGQITCPLCRTLL